jgi:hypothetical protein
MRPVAATFNRENYVLFRTYLESHRDEVRVDDLDGSAHRRGRTPRDRLSEGLAQYSGARGKLSGSARRPYRRYPHHLDIAVLYKPI